MAIEIIRIFGNAVGHVMLHPVPYEFGWIELRGIPRKKMRMNMRMAFKESLDRSGFVRSASIPQNHKPPLQMPEKISQKSQDLGMPDVFQGVKTNIQGNPAFTRRNTDRGDSGYLRPSTGDFKNRGLSDRSPSLSDARDKAKPTLVEEDKRDVKPFGLFLYAAKYGASTVLSPSHLALGLLSLASDSSSPVLSKTTRYYLGDRKPETSFQSPGQFSGLSTNRFGIRSSSLHRSVSGQGVSSGARLASMGVQGQVLTSRHHLLFSYEDRSSSKPNTTNNRLSVLSPADSSLRRAVEGPAAYALQVALGFHGVSWNQFITLLLLLRNSIEVQQEPERQ